MFQASFTFIPTAPMDGKKDIDTYEEKIGNESH